MMPKRVAIVHRRPPMIFMRSHSRKLLSRNHRPLCLERSYTSSGTDFSVGCRM